MKQRRARTTFQRLMIFVGCAGIFVAVVQEMNKSGYYLLNVLSGLTTPEMILYVPILVAGLWRPQLKTG